MPPTIDEVPVAGTGVHPRVRFARCRAMLYSVLAQSLSSPTRSLCDAMERGEIAGLVEQAIAVLPAFYLRGMDTDFLEQFAWTENAGSFEHAIGIEYTRLFALNIHCPQYEADYSGHSAFHWSQVISGVSSMYSLFGVRLGDGAAERPDHIAVELDFMNLLAAREARALEVKDGERAGVCRNAQKIFFAAHVARWGGGFARKLKEEARIDFYHGVARLLDAFLRVEARYLKAELADAEVAAPAAEAAAGQDAASGCGCSEKEPLRSELVQLTSARTEPRHFESLQGKE